VLSNTSRSYLAMQHGRLRRADAVESPLLSGWRYRTSRCGGHGNSGLSFQRAAPREACGYMSATRVHMYAQGWAREIRYFRYSQTKLSIANNPHALRPSRVYWNAEPRRLGLEITAGRRSHLSTVSRARPVSRFSCRAQSRKIMT
jgi:hypothetical protein